MCIRDRYRVPNLWQNRIADDLRVMAAFAPIDDAHTKIYLRLYQRMVRVPMLRGLVCAVGNVANGVILHQDRRVVLTQRPKKTELQMGENLLRGDAPVIEFRSRRDELKRAARQAGRSISSPASAERGGRSPATDGTHARPPRRFRGRCRARRTS